MPAGVTNRDYKPLPGRMGNLTQLQLHALEQLKKELTEEGHFVEERMDDATLLRFLRARKFDVTAAKAMLLDCEKWRQEVGVDDIMKNFDFKEKEQVDKYYPQYYHKMDKDGRPIYIELLGNFDYKALYGLTTQDRLIKQLVWDYEKFITTRLPACSKLVGYPVETSCTILDLSYISLTNFYHVKDYVSQAIAIGQNRYPESMGKFYIVNAPYLFSTVWSLIKPWLDEVTAAKIAILGSNYQPELLKQIPAENLPKYLGGKCECPGGCSLSDAGPWNMPECQEKEKEAAFANGHSANGVAPEA
ncbi:hypothetical protein E1B28_003860 [Marasmius oreades]|uniref:CRAL-TRIO domain-containing protein n=1 Tax=Marasmius oreades TaxID=181124 RepID=A0A9P7UXF1_9AGAR|nr:uncharacterized protein E1B28_003860 [Marasmius oreades]KAG7096421.1 hypothetical protein E1B28_003860 [Marasmius oreades]